MFLFVDDSLSLFLSLSPHLSLSLSLPLSLSLSLSLSQRILLNSCCGGLETRLCTRDICGIVWD